MPDAQVLKLIVVLTKGVCLPAHTAATDCDHGIALWIHRYACQAYEALVESLSPGGWQRGFTPGFNGAIDQL